MSLFLSNPAIHLQPSTSSHFFFPFASPLRLLPLLLSSLLSAACCTVWVPLRGLHTVCMCLGWQTGLTHLPGAFPPPPPSLHPSLPCRRLRCTFVCVAIASDVWYVRLFHSSVRLIFPLSPFFSLKWWERRGEGVLSHLHSRECFTGCHTHTHSQSLLETHTRRVRATTKDRGRRQASVCYKDTSNTEDGQRDVTVDVCVVTRVTHTYVF